MTPTPEDRYELLEELTHTASSSVRLCWDRVLQREVVLQGPGAGTKGSLDTADLDRRLREARMLARVQHPGVQRLLDVLDHPAGPVLVLEPIAGESLAETLRRKNPLAPEQVEEIAKSLCDALDAIHRAGVVHRGISEGNILLTPTGEVVLTGFDFSKPSGESRATSIDYGQSMRELLPRHIAPEQWEGQPADARSDIFALSCVLYRALTGHDAFEDVGATQARPTPRDPAEMVTDAPIALVEAIRRGLELRPRRRFQSAADMRVALDRGDAPPAGRSGSSGRWTVLAAGTAVALVSVTIWWALTTKPGSDLRASSDLGRARVSMGTYEPTYKDSHALLIGIDYTDRSDAFVPLSNASRDVDALASSLLNLGWQGSLIRRLVGSEATRDRIEAELEAIENRAGRDDQLFIYYAGHGVVHRLQRFGWAIPSDAGPAPSESQEGERWLPFSRFVDVFQRTEAKHVLIALDCCHSGAAGIPRGSDPVVRAYSEQYLTGQAHQLIASSRPNQRAWDGVDGHSPFATAFLDGLERAEQAPITATQINGLVQASLAGQGWPQAPVLSVFGGDAEFVFLDLRGLGD